MRERSKETRRVKTYRIPFESWVSPKDTWNELFDNIRSGKEKLVQSKIIDETTIEIHTEKKT